jgi:hypothetical protein
VDRTEENVAEGYEFFSKKERSVGIPVRNCIYERKF